MKPDLAHLQSAGVSWLFCGGAALKKAAASLRVKAHRKLPSGVHWFRYRAVR